MRVLLVKPPATSDFGLSPFFQTEPLGLQYVASALALAGHEATIVDLRFERRRLQQVLRQIRPDLVGISAVHILDVEDARRVADEVKSFDAKTRVVVGGHAVSTFPEALESCSHIDAVALGEGERTMPAVCAALVGHRSLDSVPGLLLRDGATKLVASRGAADQLSLSGGAPPDRRAVAEYQRRYCCLNYMPVWTLETARGCRHRCKFCSVWQFHGRSLRFHPLETVTADFRAIGHNVFVVDDTFWSGPERSAALADALLSSRVRKNWMLVQSRLDTVLEHPELLERWRPLARSFDVFFGFEAPTSRGLRALHKDVDVEKTVEAVRVTRRLGFGVTGNFIVDPDYGEEDFEALWAFLRDNQLWRVGFTILTPLPGTAYFEEMRARLEVLDWSQYDLHHLLWRPRLPVRRFFELYCETWRRSVLHLGGEKSLWSWLKAVQPLEVPRLLRILARTQRLMDVKAYLAETRVQQTPSA